jgi:Fic family protein
MSFDPLQPYTDLPDLPPAVDVESKTVLKACIDARAALAELKSAGQRMPNQAVLINTIPSLEAQASSEIENIVTTTDALFRYAHMEDRVEDAATREALRYRGALRAGIESLRTRPLSTRVAEEVCTRIKGVDMQVRRVPGTALANPATSHVIYTPPVGESLLRTKLANWESFIHECTELDPLVRMAVAHYQFEAIHPFTDGNGRTGRILNLLMLVEQSLLDQPVLYLSRHILRHKADYYRRLLAVTTDGAWEPWVLYMLGAVAETSRWTTAKIAAIRQLQDAAVAVVRARAGKLYSRELVDLLFVQPYCRIQNIVDAGIAKRQTASVYMQELVSIGMLQEVKVGREKLFIHANFMRLLTAEDHVVPSY